VLKCQGEKRIARDHPRQKKGSVTLAKDGSPDQELFKVPATWSSVPAQDSALLGAGIDGFAGKGGFRFQCSGFSFCVSFS
jgi:hypothetical protein